MKNNTTNIKNAKFVFFGTDELAVICIRTLKEAGLVPSLIVTTPDRPAGRKLHLTPPPVKVWAETSGISVTQPENLKEVPAELKTGKFLFGIVASYGQIIPQAVIDLFPKGLLNIHPSLLPRFRGATPLESAILSADEKTGVTIMLLDKEMDHGPILARKETTLDNKNYLDLRQELSECGANLVSQVLPLWLEDKIEPQEQNHDLATYTKKLTKTDGEISLDDDPILNHKKIRAFCDWPVAYFFVNKGDKDIRVKVTQAHLDLETSELVLDKVIPEGRREMKWEDFKRGL